MMKEVILSNGRTLFEETESFERKMSSDDRKKKALIKTIKEELYGHVQIEQIPFDLQEEFTRSKLNIPPHIWESYDCELRGKTIAVEIVRSQLDTLDRFESILKRNKKSK